MSSNESNAPSFERRLIGLLAMIAAIAVVGVLAIVPYRLYQRDVRLAEVNAHRVGSLLHASLSRELERGADAAEIAKVVNRYQGLGDLEIQLRPLAEGELAPGGASARARSERRDTDLRYTAAPILDRDGHAWLATVRFDLSPMKRESMRLIFDLVLAVVLGSVAFSVAVFLLIRHTMVKPLQELTERVGRYASGGDLGPAPEIESRELRSLLDALEQARRAQT